MKMKVAEVLMVVSLVMVTVLQKTVEMLDVLKHFAQVVALKAAVVVMMEVYVWQLNFLH